MYDRAGYRAYKYYMAVKLHFTSEKYDAVAQKGAVKCSPEKFSSRNDHYLFTKYASKFSTDKDLIDCLVANFAYGNPEAIYNFNQTFENYNEWKRRRESLTQVFREDLSKIVLHAEKEDLSFDHVFKFVDGHPPELLKLFLGSIITIETMVLLNKYIGFVDDWKSNYANLLWQKELLTIKKYDRFLKSNDKIGLVYQSFIQEFQKQNV